MENETKDLNKEFFKYNKAVVKLLDVSLKEGEYFLFTKRSDKDGSGVGVVLSRERLKGFHAPQYEKILDILEQNTEQEGVKYIINIPIKADV